MAVKFKGIEEIKQNITIRNFNEFNKIETKTFNVGGNPWSLKLKKLELNEDFLDVRLFSKEQNRPINWAIIVSIATKVVSIKSNVNSLMFESQTYVFDRKTTDWGIGYVIPWKRLIDTEQGYVYNDTCKIVVKVKSSPMLDEDDNQLIELTPIDKCCDASTKGTFRLKVNDVHDFVNICSREIKMKNSVWRFIVCKTDNLEFSGAMRNNVVVEDVLQFKLFNPAMKYHDKQSVMTKLTCKIIPSEPNADAVMKKMGRKEFVWGIIEQTLNIISWTELFDSRKKLIENDSFTLEICLEVLEAGKQAVDGAENDRNDDSKVVCPICFDNLAGKSISIPSCRHLFCTDCIELAIQNNPICPKCNGAITPNQLQRVYSSVE